MALSKSYLDGISLIRVQSPEGYTSGEYSPVDIYSLFHPADVVYNFPKDTKYIFYWYSEGSYCGAGYALFWNGKNKWWLKSMSHCSCNGPMEYLNDFREYFKTLDELKNNGTPDWLKETICLFDEAEKYTKKDKLIENKKFLEPSGEQEFHPISGLEL